VAVEAKGLGKSFGPKRALAPLDLTVRREELVGVVGPSGCGKTTLFRLLYGALRPTEGSIRVLGSHLWSVSPGDLRRLRRRIGVVPQSHGLIPSLTAAQNVAMGLAGGQSILDTLRTMTGLDRTLWEAAYGALARVGIEGLIAQRVDQLSGGQQQRVAVARAIVQDPDLLIADEPVASVDGDTARTVMDVLASFAAAGRTVLVSLHQPGLAAAYCSRSINLARAGTVAS
jgi:phosphonate transport system ATP-binding protein